MIGHLRNPAGRDEGGRLDPAQADQRDLVGGRDKRLLVLESVARAEENGREFDVAVNPRITTNDMWIMVRTACAGGGLTFGPEEVFRPYIERGELIPLLVEYLPPFPGFFLHFADRRNLPPKLRALIDHVRYRAPTDGS